jgi:hypothetical protein
MTTFNDPLELVSLSVLLTIPPHEIVDTFPILDKLKELKTYRIKLTDEIILNIHKRSYISLYNLIEDAEFMFNNFDEFIEIYDLTGDYPSVNFDDFIKNISEYKAKFFREFALFLSTIPPEIYKELVENKKTIEDIEKDILIKNLLL